MRLVVSERVHHRTCPFCEATCGLEVTLDGDRVTSVRGDRDDVFSRGFICPKAHGLKELHEDADRLTTPLVRRDGELREAGWDEAFAEIDRRLSPILASHGRNAVATYVGNPSAHNLSFLTFGPVLLRALGSHNIFTASTVDQMPKQVAAGLMFGHLLSVPVPDVDRCDHLLVLGANPLVSNGSLLTAPNMRGRLRGIRERGGKVVVVDPRRTRTAEEADEHHFIRPGSDALLLAAIACTLVRGGARGSRGRSPSTARASPRSASWCATSRPRRWPPPRGIAAADDPADGTRAGGGGARRRVRAHRHDARRSSGRSPAGSSTSSTCSPATSTARAGRCSRWPRPGSGTRPGAPGAGRGVSLGRWQSRVRGLASSSASCRWPVSRRRSTRRATGRFAR